jgi:hypothetical protein
MPEKDKESPKRKPLRAGGLQVSNVVRPSSASSPMPEIAMTAQPPGVIGNGVPVPPPAYEFLGQLPDSYGTRKLFLVARDPHLLFAYWDLTPEQYQEAANFAHDGKVFLELYVPGEGRVQQIHVWDSHKNWYLQVSRPNTPFVAQLGYYRNDGGFEVLARSAETRTPRDDLSPDTDATFVTIPFHLTFQELYDLIARQVKPGEELAETLARLEKSDYELPFQARIPRALSAKETDELFGYLSDEERRRMGGSFEITEMLRKRYENALSSGQWTSSAGAWVTSVSSPFGASFGKPRGFHLHVNAELIIYGGTEPSAKLRIDGKKIELSPDGTFAYHFVLPDGQFHIPVEATSADGAETRSALLSFLRMTETLGDVRKTGQPVMDEPIGRKA